MQLFSGSSELFVEQAINNQISSTLEENFRRYFCFSPSSSEVNSWTVSLRDLAFSLRQANLTKTGIIVEYVLSPTKRRLDAMLVGVGRDKRERGVIVELKQWKTAYKCGIENSIVFTQGSKRTPSPHPSQQAGEYAKHLTLFHPAFYSNTNSDDYIDIKACSFLHNAHSTKCGDLLDIEFSQLLSTNPLFTGDQRHQMEAYLSETVGQGDDGQILQKVIQSKHIPSKKLLDHVSDMIEGNPVYALFDEQVTVLNIVMTKMKEMQLRSSKVVIIVEGGPGTGKSVIAARLVAEVAKLGNSVRHVTGSRAFTTNIQAKVGKKAAKLFGYFNNFTKEEPNSIDVIIADEAHRLREKTTDFYNRPIGTKPQIYELIDAARVSVFLLDKHQVVRPGEVGTPEFIQQAAEARNAEIFRIELKDQYRCAGSDSYLKWLDNAFGLGNENDISWKDDYEFVVCDSPEKLESRIVDRFKQGNTARLVAGFCWKWSKEKEDGTLIEDVIIGNWNKPWNRKVQGSPPADRHPYTIWATEDEGFKQIGCIYSAQGMEFDYCGVIVGNDLVWNDEESEWQAVSKNSFDNQVKRSDNLVRNLANTYRVLMSRGMKGTYVYFLNNENRKHFEKLLRG